MVIAVTPNEIYPQWPCARIAKGRPAEASTHVGAYISIRRATAESLMEVCLNLRNQSTTARSSILLAVKMRALCEIVAPMRRHPHFSRIHSSRRHQIRVWIRFEASAELRSRRQRPFFIVALRGLRETYEASPTAAWPKPVPVVLVFYRDVSSICQLAPLGPETSRSEANETGNYNMRDSAA